MKKHTKEKSETDEVQVKRDYAGKEASPYREWLDKKGDYNQEHASKEPKEANPDILDERKGLFYQSPIDDDRLDAITAVMATLTEKQLEILRMCGNEGRTMENCAIILGISKGTVQRTLERIRKKVSVLQERGF